MICPKCGTEYQEGFTECSDCKEELIPSSVSDAVSFPANLTDKGISLLKYGLRMLYITIFQFVAVIIIYEFYVIYARNNGGVENSNVLYNIHPIIWILALFQFIMSLVIISWGSKQTKGNENRR